MKLCLNFDISMTFDQGQEIIDLNEVHTFIDSISCLHLANFILHTKFMEIGPLVLEKIFEGFLPYMGVTAILVM